METLFIRFADNYEKQKKKVLEYFKEVKEIEIGIYVPCRFVNWLSVISDVVPSNRIRFIDDNQILQGTYYPGFNNPIENFEHFMKNPTERLMIATYTYETVINKKILNSGYKGKITNLRELFQ